VNTTNDIAIFCEYALYRPKGPVFRFLISTEFEFDIVVVIIYYEKKKEGRGREGIVFKSIGMEGF